MRIILNGRKVGNGDDACYFENTAYFTKKGLKKRTILHELYHHLAYSYGLDKSDRVEEKEANSYAKNFLKNHIRKQLSSKWLSKARVQSTYTSSIGNIISSNIRAIIKNKIK